MLEPAHAAFVAAMDTPMMGRVSLDANAETGKWIIGEKTIPERTPKLLWWALPCEQLAHDRITDVSGHRRAVG
jgi:hypothetical protein